MKKEKLELVKLTKRQEEAIRFMIIESMRDVYANSGVDPDAGFEYTAGSIADRIIHNAQMALIQDVVFERAVNNSKPIKKAKKVIKKHVRK